MFLAVIMHYVSAPESRQSGVICRKLPSNTAVIVKRLQPILQAYGSLTCIDNFALLQPLSILPVSNEIFCTYTVRVTQVVKNILIQVNIFTTLDLFCLHRDRSSLTFLDAILTFNICTSPPIFQLRAHRDELGKQVVP